VEKSRVLFLSYNGLLEPILPSQVVPYLKELARHGFVFTLLTYEKSKDLKSAGKSGIDSKKSELAACDIEWEYIRYHKNPPFLSTLFDLAAGILKAAHIISSKKVRLVHIRGVTPGIIMIVLSKIFRVKILFDMRGLLAEEYVGGGLWREGSASFKLVKAAERHLLEISDAVTTLTYKHMEYNKDLDYLADRSIPMDVIPCCVDMGHFSQDKGRRDKTRKRLMIDDKFVLMYAGKIGTFYLMDEMLDFFKVFSKIAPNSIFLIVTNDDAGRAMARVREIGISEGVIKVINGITFNEMNVYTECADAAIFFINPYKKFGSSPIKMGEFLASGVPVVINPGIGDTEEFVDKYNIGVVIKSFKESDFSAGAEKLVSLKSEGGLLAARCRDAASKDLSLEYGVEKYLSLYKRLIPS